MDMQKVAQEIQQAMTNSEPVETHCHLPYITKEEIEDKIKHLEKGIRILKLNKSKHSLTTDKILKNVGFNRTEVLKHWYFVAKCQYHYILH